MQKFKKRIPALKGSVKFDKSATRNLVIGLQLHKPLKIWSGYSIRVFDTWPVEPFPSRTVRYRSLPLIVTDVSQLAVGSTVSEESSANLSQRQAGALQLATVSKSRLSRRLLPAISVFPYSIRASWRVRAHAISDIWTDARILGFGNLCRQIVCELVDECMTGWRGVALGRLRARRRQLGVARAGTTELRLRWGKLCPFFFWCFFSPLCRTRKEWRKWGFVWLHALLYHRRSFKFQEMELWECALFVHAIFDSVRFWRCWRGEEGAFFWLL